MKSLVEQKLHKILNAKFVEAQLDEDYPISFDRKSFKQLKSFKDRVSFCEKNLQRIASGSSRIVYKVDNEKVLKLAKNTKGLGQNETEIYWGKNNQFQQILAHTFDNDNKNLWVEMELAKSVNENHFIQILGYSLENLSIYLKYIDYTFIRPDKKLSDMYKRMLLNVDDEANELSLDQFNSNKFAALLAEFMKTTKSPNGDYCKLNSYGLVQRSGKPHIVLIDFGLTSDVYDGYYS